MIYIERHGLRDRGLTNEVPWRATRVNHNFRLIPVAAATSTSLSTMCIFIILQANNFVPY